MNDEDIEIKRLWSIDTLMVWRAEVIRSVFDVEPSDTLLEQNRDYYKAHVPSGRHMAFVATMGDVDAGCGGVCFTDELPSPDNPTGLCAYLMNIYVRPEYRNRGVAHAIVKRLVEEARQRNCDKIYLEATDQGKAIYRSLGFKDMPDMMKLL